MADIRTDLAQEAHELHRDAEGVECRDETCQGYEAHVVQVLTPQAAQALGKPVGTYVTLELDGLLRREEAGFARAVEANPVVSRALDIAGEGGEEALSTALTPYLQRAIYDPDAENATAEEIAESAVLGAVAAGVLQGGLELPRAVSDTMSDVRQVRQEVGTNQDIIDRANERIAQDMQARREAGLVPPAARAEPGPVRAAEGQNNTASTGEAENRGETVNVVQSLRRNIPELSVSQPVYSVSTQSVQSATGRTMAEKARNLFEKIKGVVTRQGFGDIEINTRSVKDDLSHGVGPAKAAVIPSIPSVIQNGTQIDYQQNWKGRPYDGYVFAAPVSMDGGTVYVAAVVKRTSKNRFYLHEVVDSNGNIIKIGNEEWANPTSLAASGDAGTQSPLPNINSIPQDGENVNTNAPVESIPVEERTWEDASNRKVNAFQYDHPELRPYYADAVRALRYELSMGTRGERIPVRDAEGYNIGTLGTPRSQASPVVHALDDAKLSYRDIDNALTAIINDQGQENYAAAKKMELVLDEMLSEGYTDVNGQFVPPDEDYIAARDAVTRGLSPDGSAYRMSEEEWGAILNQEPAHAAADVNDVYSVFGSGRENLPEHSVGAAMADPWGLFQASATEFFPEGANAAREVDMPTTDPQGRPIRKTAATAMGARAIPEEALADIQNMVLRGELSYNKVSDKSSIDRAVRTIREKGYQGALEEFSAQVRKGVVSKDMATLGQQLLINAANAGDSRTTAELLSLYAQMETAAGQAVQAASILRKLDPSDQLYAAQRTVSELEKVLRKNYKDLDITIDQNLLDEFAAQTTQEGRDAVMDRIYQNVADQVPSTWRDKWNAWRYLAMLANPRTHIRNVAGNLFFQPLRMVKDRTAAAIEAGVSALTGGKLERSKSFLTSPSLYKAAWNDWQNVKDVLSGNKYDDVRSEIESRRNIFGFRPLEFARTGNSWLLEFEDSIFKRITYADALAGYLQANGVSAEQVRNNTVDAQLMARARDYAGQEALRATYQDRNQVSDLVSRRFRENNTAAKAANTAIDAVLPFRRTPANILVRGFEYSPAGLAKALTADLVQVKRGKMTGAQAIDHIAAGLTGTGLFALGAYLFSEGLVTSGGGDDENQDRLNELTGGQNYALNLPGGGNVTLDWLAPEALPFFMGVEFMDSMGRNGFTLEGVLDAMASISDPMMELSMLQSLNDMIDSVSYVDGTGKLPALAGSALISYFTQAVPTIGGQIERSGEDVRMSTYTDKNLKLPTDVQYALGRASARIPGWDYQQVPYIDAWGRREDSGPLWLRTANNFLNPAYTSNSEVTPVDEEIQRLYDEMGDGAIVPDRPDRDITVNGARIDLSAEQYTQYAEERGQTRFSLLESIFSTPEYDALSDTDKAAAVADVYSYTDAVAKSHISDYEPDGWIADAIESDLPVETFILFRAATSGITSDKDENGKTIPNSKKDKIMEEIDRMYLSDEEKDELYYAAGYKESTIDDAPWR